MAEAQISSVVFGRVDELSTVYDFDLAPMYVASNTLGVVHRITFARRPEGGGAFVTMVPDSQPAPADGALVLRHALFRVTPLITQAAEATYHYFPDLKPPAAANTLPVLSGIKLDGIAGLHNPSDVIPIGTLVDYGNFRPLPFAKRFANLAHILEAGAAWTQVAGVAAGLGKEKLVDGMVGILGTSAVFAELRDESDLRAGGYGPVALTALVNRRTAPPVLSALSEGFTLEDESVGVPPPVVRVGQVPGVELGRPRLRTVMQRPLVAAGASPAARTTLPRSALAAGRRPVVNVRDELVTSWQTAGLALVRRPSADDTAQPTRIARSARSLRSAALGGATGRAVAATLDRLTEAASKGVDLRAGVTHVWELPIGDGWDLVLSGDSAVRVTELSTAGTALGDEEYADTLLADGREHTVELGDKVGMVAITALGRHADGTARTAEKSKPGRGAIARAATSGGRVVLGWETTGRAIQVGPTTLLARGSVLRLGAPAGVTVRSQRAASGVVAIATALAGQEVTATELPSDMTVVGVLLDNSTDAVPGPDDVVVHVDGGTARPLPLQVVAGRRTLYLYDVKPDRSQELMVVSAGITGRATLAGVVASTGTAAEWAAALAGSTLTDLVPDEQLTPDGSVSVRLEQREGARDA
jgi:hypothetical protein